MRGEPDIRSKLVFEVEDREFDEHRRDVDRYSKDAPQKFDQAGNKIQASAGRMSASMKAAFAGVVAFVGSQVIRALLAVEQKLFEMATAAQETASKFKVTFGEQRDVVDQFVATFGRLAGLTKTEGREITATLGAVAQGFGASKTQAADFAMQVVRTAADMASFNNTKLPDMLLAIRSGLAGEIEPLRRYGIELSAANVEQKAFEMTGKAVADELTQQEKTYARLALIQEQAAIQMGDLERTQNSVANGWRRLTGNIRQQAEEYAQKWLPTMGKVISAANDLFASSTELAGAVKTARAEIEDLGRVEKAIDTVEELQGKTSLTANENERLRESLKLLEERYPGYIKQTNAAGEAVSFFTDALRAAVNEQRELHRSVETRRLGDLVERFQEGRVGGARARSLQRQFADAIPGARAEAERQASASPLSSARREAEAELDKLESALNKYGEQALTAEARSRGAVREIVELFKVGANFNADRMIDELAATGLTISEAQSMAAQLIATYIQLQRVQEGVADSAPRVTPGSANDLPDDAIDIPSRVITADDVAKAVEVLDKLKEAHDLATAGSEKEKRILGEIFSLQEQLAQIEEVKKTLGAEAVREQEEFVRTRLKLLREELANAEELRVKYKEAADAFSGLVSRQGQGAVEAAGFDFAQKDPTLRDLQENGLISDDALRNVGMTADEAERLAKALNKDLKAADEINDVFDAIASSIRIVARSVDVFGDLSDHTRRIADGVADALDNLGKIDSGFLAGAGSAVSTALPYIGVAAGIASAVKGLIGAVNADSEQRKKEARERADDLRKLRDALRDNARRVSDAVERFTAAAVQGGNLTGTQRDTLATRFGIFQRTFLDGNDPAAERRAALEEEIARLQRMLENQDLPENARRAIESELQALIEELANLPAAILPSQAETAQAFREFLEDLKDYGVDGDVFTDLFESLLADGFSVRDAIDQIMSGTAQSMTVGLQELIDNMLSVGEVSESIAGAIEAFQRLTQLAGVEVPDAFRQMIDFLLANVDGLNDDLTELLKESQGLDLSSPDGRARLREIVAAIAANFPQFLGGLNSAELRSLLDTMLNAAGQGATGEGEFARSTTLAQTVTEIQANEFVALQEELVFIAGGILDLLRMMAGVGSGFPPYDGGIVPGNLSAAISQVRSSSLPAGTSEAVAAASGNSFSLDGWVFNMPRGQHLDDQLIDELLLVIGDRLRNRGKYKL